MFKRFLLFSFISLSVFVSVNAQNRPPKVTTDTTICKGSSIDLYTLIKDYGTITGQNWYKYPSNEGVPDYNTVVKPTAEEKFTLVYRYLNGNTGSVIVSIKVADAAVIEAMGDVTVCDGSGLQLTLKSAINADSVWWQAAYNPGLIYANNSTVTVGNPSETDDHEVTYLVYAQNNSCTSIVGQDQVKVDVRVPLLSASLKVNDEYSFCYGETVNLNQMLYFVVSNSKGKEFIYNINDSEVSHFQVSWLGISNPSAYTVTNNVTLTANVSAQILITSHCGNVSRTFSNQPIAIDLKVQGTKPSLTHQSVGSTLNYYPYVVCKNDVVEINVLSGSCGTIDTVEWLSPAINHTDRTEATPSKWVYAWKPSATTTFTAKIKTKNTSSGVYEDETTSIIIDVKNYPDLVAIKDTSACDNLSQTIDLNGLLDTSVYVGLPNWGGINPILVNPNENKSYHVTATSKYRCQNMADFQIEGDINVQVNSLVNVTAMADTSICLGYSVTLSANALGSVYWSNSVGGAPISATQTPNVTTRYYVNAVNACGLSADSVLVTVNNPPTLTLRADTTVCVKEAVNLYATNFNGDSILWSVNNKWINAANVTVNPTQTTVYTAKGFKNKCETLATVTVSVMPTPYLKAMDDKTICQGQSVTLTANSDETVIWNVPNTTVTPITNTSYYVSASNGTCTAYDTVNIYISAPPVVVAMADTFVCYGEIVTLTATGGGNISWNVPNTTFKATQTAQYIVTATSVGCADAKDTVVVTVNDSLYINPSKLPRYQRGVPYSVGLETNAQAPHFVITDGNLPAGFYLSNSGLINGLSSDDGKLEKAKFVVEITDLNGCKLDKDYLLEGEIFIAEVFTPNGDGFNDYFMQGNHVIIFSRLGVKLFDGEDGWDGTYRGVVMPPDTYYYVVTVINESGNKEKKSGSISIVKR